MITLTLRVILHISGTRAGLRWPARSPRNCRPPGWSWSHLMAPRTGLVVYGLYYVLYWSVLWAVLSLEQGTSAWGHSSSQGRSCQARGCSSVDLTVLCYWLKDHLHDDLHWWLVGSEYLRFAACLRVPRGSADFHDNFRETFKNIWNVLRQRSTFLLIRTNKLVINRPSVAEAVLQTSPSLII